MRACMGVALEGMIDNGVKITKERTSSTSDLNNTLFQINATCFNCNDSIGFPINENVNGTDAESNKREENGTVTYSNENKGFEANGYLNALLFTAPVSIFSIVSKSCCWIGIKKVFT